LEECATNTVYALEVVVMNKNTTIFTAEEFLHNALLSNAVNKDDKETFDRLIDKDYSLVKEEE
jgi:hypothetical protein